MNKKDIFVSTCIAGIDTLTEGKDYEVLTEDGWQIVVVDENKNKITVMRDRFAEIKLKSVNKNVLKVVTCTDASNFKNLRSGDSYEVVEETPSYFYINSPKGVKMRYGRKYFNDNEEVHAAQPAKPAGKPTPAAPKAPEKKSYRAECLYPVNGILTYKKSYSFEEKGENHIVVTDDKGNKTEFLKKRFNIVQ